MRDTGIGSSMGVSQAKLVVDNVVGDVINEISDVDGNEES